MTEDAKLVVEVAERLLRSIGYVGDIRTFSRIDYVTEKDARDAAEEDGYDQLLQINGSGIDMVGKMLDAQQSCRNHWRAYRYIDFNLDGTKQYGAILAFADVVDAIFMKMLT